MLDSGYGRWRTADLSSGDSNRHVATTDGRDTRSDFDIDEGDGVGSRFAGVPPSVCVVGAAIGGIDGGRNIVMMHHHLWFVHACSM